MKKIVIILVCYMMCMNICACSDNRSFKGYAEEITDETVINNITIKKHVITAEYQGEEGVYSFPEYSYVNALIAFPQLSDMKDRTAQEKINEQLKEAATQYLSHTSFDETLKLFEDIANGEIETSEFWSGENEYTVLYVGDNYISLNYEGDIFSGGVHPCFFSDYVTISLETGEKIPFTDFFSKEDLVDAIMSLDFEWIEGQYTGGYKGNEPEVIEQFVAAVKQLEDIDRAENIYSQGSVYDFAMDEQFAYINFYFYDSLDGYVTLRFNLDVLK